ncbi:MAG: hypothetical protein JNM98_05990 [Rhodocyclaceae bacterium]|nr:hypothetical protein [Rhodocyclaceae bacterium]
MTAPPLPGSLLAWGQPWHGTWESEGLRLATNGQILPGAIAPADQHVHYISLGMPTPSTPADLAAQGGLLMPDAVLIGQTKRYSPMSSAGIGRASTLMRDPAGTIWRVSGSLRQTEEWISDPHSSQMRGIHAYVDLTAQEWGRIGGAPAAAPVSLGTLDAGLLGWFWAPYEDFTQAEPYRAWRLVPTGLTLHVDPTLQSGLVVIDGHLTASHNDWYSTDMACWCGVITLTGAGVSLTPLQCGAAGWSYVSHSSGVGGAQQDWTQTITLGAVYSGASAVLVVSDDHWEHSYDGSQFNEVYTYSRVTCGGSVLMVEQRYTTSHNQAVVQYWDTMGGTFPGDVPGLDPEPDMVRIRALPAGAWWIGWTGYVDTRYGEGSQRGLVGISPVWTGPRTPSSGYDPRTQSIASGARI